MAKKLYLVNITEKYMMFSQVMLQRQQFVISLILLSVTSVTIFLPNLRVEALQLKTDDIHLDNPTHKNTKPVLTNEDDNACEAYNFGFLVARTKNFYIEICSVNNKPSSYYVLSKDKPLSHYGIERKSPHSTIYETVLDIKSYRFNNKVPSKSERFLAVHRNVEFILARGLFTVKKGNKILVQEKVINYKRLIP